jgi:uncharacterized protein YggU (UPF0235/DUF167 family)
MQLCVYVMPKSPRNALDGFREDASGRRELVCRVTQAPEGGKATKAVCALVAKSLGISRSQVTCVRGQTARHKQLEVECPPERFEAWLEAQ